MECFEKKSGTSLKRAKKISVLLCDCLGMGIAVLACGLTVRAIVSFIAVMGIGFNLKEKFFIPLAWLPKATVQAAIGSMALDTAKAQEPCTEEDIERGLQVRYSP